MLFALFTCTFQLLMFPGWVFIVLLKHVYEAHTPCSFYSLTMPSHENSSYAVFLHVLPNLADEVGTTPQYSYIVFGGLPILHETLTPSVSRSLGILYIGSTRYFYEFLYS